MKRLENRVAIVTGANSGICRAIAIAFGKEGAKVVCASRTEYPHEAGFETDKDKSTAQVICENGGEAAYMQCDVSVSEQVEALVGKTVEKYRKLDIIVNGAGVFTQLKPIHEMPNEDYDFTMAINAKGCWNGCKYAITQFMKQSTGGKVINIASVGGLVGLANEPDYCASKGAIVNLTRQLAADYSKYGIRVNAICPGAIKSSMSRGPYEVPEIREFLSQAHPIGRWGDTEEFGGPALFLASEDSSYVTGAILPVDGGYTAQ